MKKSGLTQEGGGEERREEEGDKEEQGNQKEIELKEKRKTQEQRPGRRAPTVCTGPGKGVGGDYHWTE